MTSIVSIFRIRCSYEYIHVSTLNVLFRWFSRFLKDSTTFLYELGGVWWRDFSKNILPKLGWIEHHSVDPYGYQWMKIINIRTSPDTFPVFVIALLRTFFQTLGMHFFYTADLWFNKSRRYSMTSIYIRWSMFSSSVVSCKPMNEKCSLN